MHKTFFPFCLRSFRV